jgi:hypothetical protein
MMSSVAGSIAIRRERRMAKAEVATLTQGGTMSTTLKTAYWTLVFGAFLLLGILGKLDLLVILLPLSLVLAFVIAGSGRRQNHLTPGIKKG